MSYVGSSRLSWGGEPLGASLCLAFSTLNKTIAWHPRWRSSAPSSGEIQVSRTSFLVHSKQRPFFSMCLWKVSRDLLMLALTLIRRVYCVFVAGKELLAKFIVQPYWPCAFLNIASALGAAFLYFTSLFKLLAEHHSWVSPLLRLRSEAAMFN